MIFIHSFFKEKDFDGLNVTIPYKQTVMEYLDHISPEATRIGAVNTIVNKNGKLYGYNTDFLIKKMLGGMGFKEEEYAVQDLCRPLIL